MRIFECGGHAMPIDNGPLRVNRDGGVDQELLIFDRGGILSLGQGSGW
jgi:hypothetical protein